MEISVLQHPMALLIYVSIHAYIHTSFSFIFFSSYFSLEEQFKTCKKDKNLASISAATRCGGNREDQFPPGNLFVAVSDGLWDNGAACGRRYRVRCLSGPNKPCRHKTIEVKVVDFCPITPCPSTIVLSKESFAAVARQDARKINVEYIQV
ncbi:hypothetical protein SLEP1_g44042 [Rubroshorea leprosula]|uniref:Expansin-like EG45 domain-containing protein n=1 Tax=Rubroshorea leprosula TaxID=152421 RepID=A0AAV5LFG7_9ROSI|nr:hypothetical protein SLEP1_g44042 [Rubroshorea leprosula]